MSGDLKAGEERKREACWDPRERWKVLQETIAWVDAQQRTPRNSPRACLAEQARKWSRATTKSHKSGEFAV